MYKYLREAVKKAEPGSSPGGPVTRQEAFGTNGNKTRKIFFTVRVRKHRHRMPREVVEFLEVLKIHLDMVLCNEL